MNLPTKTHWLDRAIEIYNFHAACCKDDDSWTIAKTSTALNRSFGSVSQDIMLAKWSMTHEIQLRKYTMKEAIDFIKKKKREMKLREI